MSKKNRPTAPASADAANTSQAQFPEAATSGKSVRGQRSVVILALIALVISLILPWLQLWSAGGQQHFRGPNTPTVVVGVSGVTWDDVDFSQLPALRQVSAVRGSVTTSVQATVTCAVDGWMTLGALTRMVDVPAHTSGKCRPVNSDPKLAREEIIAGMRQADSTPAWGELQQLVTRTRATREQAKKHDSVIEPLTVVGIGAGARWAFPDARAGKDLAQLANVDASAATAKGNNATETTSFLWAPAASDLPGQVSATLSAGAQLILVDADTASGDTFSVPRALRRQPHDGMPRLAAHTNTHVANAAGNLDIARSDPHAWSSLKRADAIVAAILASNPNTNIVVTSVADSSATHEPGIFLARSVDQQVSERELTQPPLTRGVSGAATSLATTRAGLVTTADIGAFMVDRALQGTSARLYEHSDAFPITVVAGPTPHLATLQDNDALVVAYPVAQPRAMTVWFTTSGVLLILLVLCTWLLQRQGRGQQRALRICRTVLAVLAITHVGSVGGAMLANLVPWWLWAAPTSGNEWRFAFALLGAGAAGGLLIALLALVVTRLLRAGQIRVQGRKGAWFSFRLWALTVIVIDLGLVCLGALLPQLATDSLFGSATMSAWRLHGLGNNLLGVALGLALAWTCLIFAPALRGERQLNLFSTLTAIFLPLLLACWWGDAGSNFGSVAGWAGLAAVTLTLLLRRRVDLFSVLLTLLITCSLWASIGGANYVGGPTNHIGRFIGRVLNGSAGSSISRKFVHLTDTFGGPVFAIVGALVLLGLIVAATVSVRRSKKPLSRFLPASWQPYFPLVLAVLWTVACAIFLNDSGMLIAAYALAAGGPIALAGTTLARTKAH